MAFRKVVDYVTMSIGPFASHKWRSLNRFIYGWIDRTLTITKSCSDYQENVGPNPMGTVIFDSYTDPENPKINADVALADSQVNSYTPDYTDAEAPATGTEYEGEFWPTSVQLDTAGAFTDYTTAEQSGLQKGPTTLEGFGYPAGYTAADNTAYLMDTLNWAAAKITPPTGYLWRVGVKIYRVGLPGTTLTVSLQKDDGAGNPDGTDICSATIPVNSLAVSPGTVQTFTLTNWINGAPWWFPGGETWWIVMRTSGGGGTNDAGWRANTTGGSTSLMISGDGGATWSCPNAAYVFYHLYYYNDNAQGVRSIYNQYWECQTFPAAANGHLRKVVLRAYADYGDNPLVVTVHLRATAAGAPTGADIAFQNDTFVSDAHMLEQSFRAREIWAQNTSNYSPIWHRYEIVFDTPYLMTAAVVYALIVSSTQTDSGQALRWFYSTAMGYTGGQRYYSTTSGVSFIAAATDDMFFEIWYSVTDVNLLPAALTLNDAIYFGHDAKKFSTIMQDISVPGAGTYTGVWEYSQGAGAWNACVGVVDGTNGFQNQWNRTFEHTPQADWALETVNGVQAYYVRYRITGTGAGYSQPQGTYCLLGATLG